MLRDNLVGLIEPMRISARIDPLALSIQKQASDDRSSYLENPRPEGAESSLTENVTSPFQAEPAQNDLERAKQSYRGMLGLSSLADSFQYLVIHPERHCLSAPASVNTSRLIVTDLREFATPTVRPRFQPPPKARYSPTRLVVTDV